MAVQNQVKEFEIPLEMSAVCFQGMRYEWIRKPPLQVRITSQAPKRVLLEGNADYTLSIPCSRCLKSVEVAVPVRICQPLDFHQAKEDKEKEESFEEESYLDGYDLDVDLLVLHEILLKLPEKVLCKEDCKGLCPKCGQNLNEGECGCSKESIDPRMAAIQDIFNKFKEV